MITHSAKEHRLGQAIGQIFGLLACTILLATCASMLAPRLVHAMSPDDLTLENAKGTVAVTSRTASKVDASLTIKGTSYGALHDVTVSNTKVVKYKIDYASRYETYLYLDFKKAGKVTLSYVYLGKKHKVTFKYYKYKNPVSSLKVGKKQLRTALNKHPYYDGIEVTQVSGQIKIKLKKGWKLKSLEVQMLSSGNWKKVKNGYKIKKGKACAINFVAMNKKTKQVVDFDVWSP